MESTFIPERLISVREKRGISKAEASRLLDLSKMGYGRYESGQRTPSPQMIEFIAQRLGTTSAYLTGQTDDPFPDRYVIERNTDPELFSLVSEIRGCDSATLKRILYYYESLRPQK